MCALEEAFVLQICDVLMHGGERTESKAAGYFLIGGGVAVFLREAEEKIDDLFLPPCDSHAEIVANKKRIAIPLLILFRPDGKEANGRKGDYSHFEIDLCKKMH